MDDIDYERDKFEDILAKDDRYDAHAYALLMDVVMYMSESERHVSGEDILDEFKERVLDLFGPMSYTVLTEWGVKTCMDIGEMMFNLVEARRIEKDAGDTPESFAGGYDFNEAFRLPYET